MNFLTVSRFRTRPRKISKKFHPRLKWIIFGVNGVCHYGRFEVPG
jgi:hypothetical protein